MNHSNNQPQATSSTSVKTEAHDKRIDTLFIRLGAIYGHIWWSNYQNENALSVAKKEWSDTLRRFNNQILKEVLLSIRERNVFPPSLPQFFEYCMATFKRHEPYRVNREPIQPASSDIATKHLNALLRFLRP